MLLLAASGCGRVGVELLGIEIVGSAGTAGALESTSGGGAAGGNTTASGGASSAGAGGIAGLASGGASGSGDGGIAGAPTGGTSAGGSAGTAAGGAPAGGSAGTASGGVSPGGSAGTAGSASGGASVGGYGGMAGASTGGTSPGGAAGQAGTTGVEGGQAGRAGAGGIAGAGGADGAPWPDIHSPGSTVSAGNEHACAVRSGALYCWGSNATGELGTGTAGGLENRPIRVDAQNWVSVRAGYACTCGLLTDGHVLCWGDNTEGQLGQGDFNPRPTATAVSLPSPASSVSLRSTHACAILIDGSLWCWGNNFEGQLGQDDIVDAPPEPSPLRVGSAVDWQSVSAGEGHTCGIRAPGTLWCWGRNTYGQLGLGTDVPIQTRVPHQVHPATDWVSVSAGSHLSCALRATHAASCFGINPVGQAVPGEGHPQLSPDVYVAGPAGFSAVDAHVFHSCGLDLLGRAWCWGRNEEGQIGVGGWSLSEPETELSSEVFTQLSAGRFSTCAMTATDSVWCVGQNAQGQLGLGDTAVRYTLEALIFP